MTVYGPLTLVPPLTGPESPPPGIVLPQPELTTPYSYPDVRILFRQPATTEGSIDAAWWPRTRNLADELSELLDVMWTAGRDIGRVAYNLDAWGELPSKMTIGEHTVRLGGLDTSDPHIIRLIDSLGQERIDMLIVPPDADPGYARRLMHLATRVGETRRADELMAAAAQDRTLHGDTPPDLH